MKKEKNKKRKVKVRKKVKKTNNAKRRIERKYQVMEYYHLVWARIHEDYEEDIYKSCIEFPRYFRRRLVKDLKVDCSDSNVDVLHRAFLDVLFCIEDELEKIIEKHSVFFWLHMYRRIAPCLDSDLGGNTGDATVANVRSHAGQAMIKYGDLNKTNDYGLTDKVEFSNILGGLLEQYLEEAGLAGVAKAMKTELVDNPQWVLTDFCAKDMMDLYCIEGLAYQYWYVAARMRSMGKGVPLSITEEGDILECRTSEQEWLISNFDKRDREDGPNLGMVSNVGTYTRSVIGDPRSTIIVAVLNVRRDTIKDLNIKGINENFSPNYIPWYVNAESFYQSHKYLSAKFEEKNLFGLREFLQMASLLSRLMITSIPEYGPSGVDFGVSFYSKFQRGYVVLPYSLSGLKNEVVSLYQEEEKIGLFEESNIVESIDRIVDFIFLDYKKQKTVGVWSHGPRFVGIPLGECFLLDMSSWYYLLEKIFFGLRNYDPKSIKGGEFEDEFSDVLIAHEFDVVLKSKEICADGKKREVDVAVRLGEELFLFECMASERPLDFNIGKPKTINYRSDAFSKKLVQADTLKAFVEENKVGDNYDFSWASEIHSSVVSPYTEWVWGREESLWTYCGKFPRIMSVNDAINFLKSERGK